MDLMIEAKDKEQAVFELMRTFKLPGYETFNDVIPFVRNDDNKVAHAAMAKKARSKKASNSDEPEPDLIVDDEVGMGGPEGRVYWPPGMEEWLRPKKREVKKKDPVEKTPTKIKKEAVDAAPDVADGPSNADAAPAKVAKAKTAPKKATASKATTNGVKGGKKRPVLDDPLSDESELSQLEEEDDFEADTPPTKRPGVPSRKGSGRKAKKAVNYDEDDDVEMEAL